MKSKIHFLDEYLQNPYHNINVVVIGAGGTGSKVLTALARINQALIGLNKLPIHVEVYDDDKVELHNIGRQLFSVHDIGEYKAEILITRLNRFFGTSWVANCRKLESNNETIGNIVISCVDNVKTRYEISKRFKIPSSHNKKQFYWLDFGNGADYGQIILGSNNIIQPKSKKYKTISELSTFNKLFPNLIDEENDGPSCSYEESLKKQSLFINSTLVELGMNMLFELLTNHYIDYNVIYFNLASLKIAKSLK